VSQMSVSGSLSVCLSVWSSSSREERLLFHQWPNLSFDESAWKRNPRSLSRRLRQAMKDFSSASGRISASMDPLGN
jgi:hypothetical protein